MICVIMQEFGLEFRLRNYGMKPLKIRLSITLDEDIAEKIKVMAETDDRSVSQYINMVLRKWINQNKINE